MKLRIDLTSEDFTRAVVKYIEEVYGISVETGKLTIETKSTQNYKSEWETAVIRANYQTE